MSRITRVCLWMLFIPVSLVMLFHFGIKTGEVVTNYRIEKVRTLAIGDEIIDQDNQHWVIVGKKNKSMPADFGERAKNLVVFELALADDRGQRTQVWDRSVMYRSSEFIRKKQTKKQTARLN